MWGLVEDLGMNSALCFDCGCCHLPNGWDHVWSIAVGYEINIAILGPGCFEGVGMTTNLYPSFLKP